MDCKVYFRTKKKLCNFEANDMEDIEKAVQAVMSEMHKNMEPFMPPMLCFIEGGKYAK